MQPPQAPPIYEFGDFELDTLKRVLVSRITGQPVEITGRVIDALIHFVERPGQLVAKKALIEALWPHVVVEEGNLTQTIHTLRRVLGERAGEHRYIATVPGRGYRFVAEVKTRERGGVAADGNAQPASPVQPVQPVQPARPARSSRVPAWGIAAGLLLVVGIVAGSWWLNGRDDARTPAAAAPPSIAVLPFVDMSPAQDQVHFAEGLSEEILNVLARAEALRVIARTSSFSFRDDDVDIGTIAKRLAVSHVLEGSVRKSGERVRITAQLIDAASSTHVWSDTYDRDVSDIFGVQREIANAVADALHARLRAGAPTRAETRSIEAYEHYLQGRHLFNRRSDSDLLQAKSHFEQAVAIDPEYGRAWAALAGVYVVARFEGPELPDSMRQWREAAEQAIAHAPDLAEAHYRAAQYYWQAGELETGTQHAERAFALDPQEPLLVGKPLSDALRAGRYDRAVELQRQVVANDPLSATARGNLGNLLIMAGQLPEAQRELERTLELSPASAISMSNIADVLLLQGDLDSAQRAVARMPDGYLRDERAALIHFARGELRAGEAALARLVALARQRDTDFQVRVAIAGIYAAQRDADRAFTWLDDARRRANADPSVLARVYLNEVVRLSPHLGPLHADARWRGYLESIEAP